MFQASIICEEAVEYLKRTQPDNISAIVFIDLKLYCIALAFENTQSRMIQKYFNA